MGGSKAPGYREGWDPRSPGSLASCQTHLNAACRQDIDPFISCILLASPWRLRLAQEMGGRQHPCCLSGGAAHGSGGALLSVGDRGSAPTQAAVQTGPGSPKGWIVVDSAWRGH